MKPQKPIEIVSRVKRYVACLSCKSHEFSVEHLLDGNEHRAGPWYCDECGVANSFDVSKNGEIFARFDPSDVLTKTFELLRMDPAVRPEELLLVVQGIQFSKHKGDEKKDYYYDEHTCPTNYFRDVKEVFAHGASDPHGIFRWVRTIEPRIPAVRKNGRGQLITEEESAEAWLERVAPGEINGLGQYPPRWWQK